MRGRTYGISRLRKRKSKSSNQRQRSVPSEEENGREDPVLKLAADG
jgi:hypothetical protein